MSFKITGSGIAFEFVKDINALVDCNEEMLKQIESGNESTLYDSCLQMQAKINRLAMYQFTIQPTFKALKASMDFVVGSYAMGLDDLLKRINTYINGVVDQIPINPYTPAKTVFLETFSAKCALLDRQLQEMDREPSAASPYLFDHIERACANSEWLSKNSHYPIFQTIAGKLERIKKIFFSGSFTFAGSPDFAAALKGVIETFKEAAKRAATSNKKALSPMLGIQFNSPVSPIRADSAACLKSSHQSDK